MDFPTHFKQRIRLASFLHTDPARNGRGSVVVPPVYLTIHKSVSKFGGEGEGNENANLNHDHSAVLGNTQLQTKAM